MSKRKVHALYHDFDDTNKNRNNEILKDLCKENDDGIVFTLDGKDLRSSEYIDHYLPTIVIERDPSTSHLQKKRKKENDINCIILEGNIDDIIQQYMEYSPPEREIFMVNFDGMGNTNDLKTIENIMDVFVKKRTSKAYFAVTFSARVRKKGVKCRKHAQNLISIMHEYDNTAQLIYNIGYQRKRCQNMVFMVFRFGVLDKTPTIWRLKETPAPRKNKKGEWVFYAAGYSQPWTTLTEPVNLTSFRPCLI